MPRKSNRGYFVLKGRHGFTGAIGGDASGLENNMLLMEIENKVQPKPSKGESRSGWSTNGIKVDKEIDDFWDRVEGKDDFDKLLPMWTNYRGLWTVPEVEIELKLIDEGGIDARPRQARVVRAGGIGLDPKPGVTNTRGQQVMQVNQDEGTDNDVIRPTHSDRNNSLTLLSQEPGSSRSSDSSSVSGVTAAGRVLITHGKRREGTGSIKGKDRLRKRDKSEGDICAHCGVNGEDHKISGKSKTINWKGCDWCDRWFVTSCIDIVVDPTSNFWRCRECHQHQTKLDEMSEAWHDPKAGWESLHSKVGTIESSTLQLTKLMVDFIKQADKGDKSSLNKDKEISRLHDVIRLADLNRVQNEKIIKEKDSDLIEAKALLKEHLENAAIQNNQIKDLKQQLREAELALKKTQQKPIEKVTEGQSAAGSGTKRNSRTLLLDKLDTGDRADYRTLSPVKKILRENNSTSVHAFEHEYSSPPSVGNLETKEQTREGRVLFVGSSLVQCIIRDKDLEYTCLKRGWDVRMWRGGRMQDLEKLVNEVKGSGNLGEYDYIVTLGRGGE